MSDLAIRVENLSKRYRLGQREPYKSLREVVAGVVTAPVRYLQKTSDSQRGRQTQDPYLWALNDISFDVKQGEVLGIIGRNGAGKSTLLKILSRITKPTKGSAEIYGRVGSLLEVGTGFHPELSGRENIYLNGAILGMQRAEIDRKFDEIVAFAEIESFLDTPVKRYSSGMFVRLAFAVAAHLEPEILLVDEVLAVGDIAFQNKCLGKMGEVARSGRTILFVSHNMDAVQRICNSAIYLSKGQINAIGGAKEVVQTYFQSIGTNTQGQIKIAENSLYRRINLTVNNNNSGSMVIWQSGKPLQVDLVIESDQPTGCPRVDIVFFRMDNLKLLAVRSDQLINVKAYKPQLSWKLSFILSDLTLAPQRLFLDVGVRVAPLVEYCLYWQHACDMLVNAQGFKGILTEDSLVLPTIDLTVN